MSTQLLKVYNDDKSVGEPRSREDIESQGLIMANVFVVLFDESDNIWLQLRAGTKGTHPLKYDLAAGGCVHHDEESLEAAQRETAEETGLKGIKLTLAAMLEFEFEENGATVRRFPEVFYGVTDQVPKIDNDEVWGVIKLPFNDLKLKFEQHPDLFVPSLLPELEASYAALQAERDKS